MTKKKYVEKITQNMQNVKTYKPDFAILINTLAETLEDYDRAKKQFKKDGYKFMVEHTNKAGVTNLIKNPSYLIIENSRKQITVMCRELGISPAGLNRINDKEFEPAPKMSRLEAAMEKLAGGADE